MKRFLVLILLVVPAALEAQARTSISAFMAADPVVPGDPLLVGFTYAKERGPFVLRFGAGFDVSSPPEPAGDSGAPPPTSGIWSTDADALLYLGNPAGNATLIPYAVGGIGTRGLQADGGLGMALNYSYGGGFRSPLGGGLSIEGEARYRENLVELAPGALPVTESGLELRVGMTLGFGGARRLAPNAPSAPATIPAGVPRSVPAGIFTSSTSTARVAAATLSTAERYIGVPYLWGGNTPESGFDCSGFIRYVFIQHGIDLPRVSRDQARTGSAVPLRVEYFQPGDLIAFASDGRTIDHIAIYAGNGRIIHSSSSGHGVRYDDLFSSRGSWYVEHMVAARRVIDSGVMLGG